ncbi:hypothetical protein GLE_0945 [Lysobacter enzymogenes]|uniref:Uncharacterized protein n=1 Tax=Lysobacter enzymogenes TaxID=69 RepID=A0A0S2DCT7_LYSEN|nr:hypothetical protein [Lysobacter enzymogenes]ALN56303.1 hypothetical protein GLE_0945 [Lysobacter enzymogenes]QCW25174.1 hypothetical protein FE772_05360 [Lysobacter enzymogenes]
MIRDLRKARRPAGFFFARRFVWERRESRPRKRSYCVGFVLVTWLATWLQSDTNRNGRHSGERRNPTEAMKSRRYVPKQQIAPGRHSGERWNATEAMKSRRYVPKQQIAPGRHSGERRNPF